MLSVFHFQLESVHKAKRKYLFKKSDNSEISQKNFKSMTEPHVKLTNTLIVQEVK